MSMPYYNLVEPITGYFCKKGGMSRLDYWGGTERYIYNSTGPGYMIVPTSTEDGLSSTETCFLDGDNLDPVSLFPDVTYFPKNPDAGDCTLNGLECETYTLDSPTYNETTGFIGHYVLYVNKESGHPMRFHFTGFNVVLGSHYDEYIFDYLKVVPTLEDVAPACFAPPAQMTCKILETDDDDGGGPTARLPNGVAKRPISKGDFAAPLAELKSLLPGGGAAKAAKFEAWAAKHGKSYATPEETFHRASLFHATERYVNAFNRARKSFWLGLNHMADWTPKEKKQLRGRLHTPAGTTVPATKEHTTRHGTAADDVDWRAVGAVTPPKDQGTCGSCWSYGATGTTEGQVFLKTGKLTPLSQQNLMDCSWNEGNNACDGGLDFKAYAWMLEHGGGLATEASYPYLNADGYCRYESSTIGATISGYANITDGLDGLNDALNTVGPISVSIDASPDSFYFYMGGLYYSEDCHSGMENLDHTVLAVGLMTDADGTKYSIVKNSWSDHWGDDGFVYISQKDYCCGVATQPTYTILA